MQFEFHSEISRTTVTETDMVLGEYDHRRLVRDAPRRDGRQRDDIPERGPPTSQIKTDLPGDQQRAGAAAIQASRPRY